MTKCPECGKDMPDPGFGLLGDNVCAECEKRHREIAERKREQKLRAELNEIERKKH